MTKDDLSDDYVANLLKEDAKKSSQRYAQIGLGALLKRPTTNAPKPNVRFLRNILRETDSHNSALLAREAEEAKERLRQLQKERDGQRRHGHGESKKRRREHDEVDYGRLKRRRDHDHDHDEEHYKGSKRRHDDGQVKSSRRYESRSRSRSRSRSPKRSDKGRASRAPREDSSSDREAHNHKSRRKEHRSSRTRRDEEKHWRSRPSHRSDDTVRMKHSSRKRSSSTSSRTPSADRHRSKVSHKSSMSQAQSQSQITAEESDPLEDIVGPLLPKPGPPVRKRGRGAFTTTGTSVDAHFEADYDPSVDVRPSSDVEDDWEQALEVIRDRQKWNQQGADRLRQAGFTDEQVRKWEKGDEKTEEDVRWAKKGEGREWDRGKVVDEDGDIKLQAEGWGRLKGT